MRKNIMFYPNDEDSKSPVGALSVNDSVRLRLRFSKPENPVAVYLVIAKDGEAQMHYPMNQVSHDVDGTFTFELSQQITSVGLYFYHFLIQTDDMDIPVGADSDLSAMLGKGGDWQLTVFDRKYAPCNWLNGGLIYQIMVDRFFVGGERKKTKPYAVYRDDWGATPEYRPNSEGVIENIDFFGGNIKGVTKKLAYLKSLGVTCIYLNPIFEARSNHKYDTGNYMRIDPDFGTEDDLKELIKKADKRGIKVILDGVFSHTGDDSIYFNKYGNYDSVGAYQSPKSPYYDWYSFKNWPNDYECWWNLSTLPNTKEENAMFNEYINGEAGVVRYWTRYGIAGWRLDVCDELPDGFLESCSHAAKSVCDNALMLGEVWEDASNKVTYGKRRKYLQGAQLDSVTNYPFKEDIINFIRCGDGKRLNNTVNYIINNYPRYVVNNLMNLLDTHDTARILSVLGDSGVVVSRDDKANAKVQNLADAVAAVKIASALQYTLPGVPCVYYGDEVGLEGFEDPFNRRCFPWDNRNKDLLRWYKKLGLLRTRERTVFAEGDYQVLDTTDGIYAFMRTNGSQTVYVAANSTSSYYTMPNIASDEMTDLITLKPFKGVIPPHSAVIFKRTSDVVFPEKK